jgi:hypothetical protein
MIPLPQDLEHWVGPGMEEAATYGVLDNVTVADINK